MRWAVCIIILFSIIPKIFSVFLRSDIITFDCVIKILIFSTMNLDILVFGEFLEVDTEKYKKSNKKQKIAKLITIERKRIEYSIPLGTFRRLLSLNVTLKRYVERRPFLLIFSLVIKFCFIKSFSGDIHHLPHILTKLKVLNQLAGDKYLQPFYF